MLLYASFVCAAALLRHVMFTRVSIGGATRATRRRYYGCCRNIGITWLRWLPVTVGYYYYAMSQSY